jgi:hypothetical protein
LARRRRAGQRASARSETLSRPVPGLTPDFTYAEVYRAPSVTEAFMAGFQLERWGIINLVVSENELPTASMSWARQLAAGPTVALRGIKTLANLSARHGISGADAQQVDTNNQMWASKDQKRGLTAFLATGPGSAVFEGN